MTKAEIAAGLDRWEALIRNSRHSSAYLARREKERAAAAKKKA